MSFEQYGLSVTSASSADHDKGIVAGPDGKFYQIDGFKRVQKDKLDKDKGAAFSSGLKEAGAAAGFNPTTFNTATDVENALKAIGAPEEKSEVAPYSDENIEISPRLATARARAAQYEEDRISGQASKDLYDSAHNSAEGFLERYKLKLGERLENGSYREPEYNTTNSSNVASGENDVSLDTAEYSRTGKDNRKGY